MIIYLKTIKKKYKVSISIKSTIYDLKRLIDNHFDIAPTEQIIINNGTICQDSNKLVLLNITLLLFTRNNIYLHQSNDLNVTSPDNEIDELVNSLNAPLNMPLENTTMDNHAPDHAAHDTITETDRIKINQLVELGVSFRTASMAYFMSNRDENVAANILIDMT